MKKMFSRFALVLSVALALSCGLVGCTDKKNTPTNEKQEQTQVKETDEDIINKLVGTWQCTEPSGFGGSVTFTYTFRSDGTLEIQPQNESYFFGQFKYDLDEDVYYVSYCWERGGFVIHLILKKDGSSFKNIEWNQVLHRV